MPLIVVGADTPAGEAILGELDPPRREVRAFVTDEERALALRERGFKVATGDVSDDSHVESAALHCHSAILITEAASDGRERSFATDPQDVLRGWARAVTSSGVKRVIWVTTGEVPETGAREVVSVSADDPRLAEVVVALDEAHSIE